MPPGRREIPSEDERRIAEKEARMRAIIAAGKTTTTVPQSGWEKLMNNIVGAYNAADTLYGIIRPSSTQDVVNQTAVIKDTIENPENLILEPLRSANRVVDVLPYIDTGEPGVDYINAYNRGEGLTMGVNDALNLFAIASAAKAAPGAIRTNITNPGARFNPYEYGFHINVSGEAGDIGKIIPRQPGQATAVGGDSIPGKTYMWDATAPDIVEMIMSNPQMTNSGILEILYENPPAAYFTRAPRSRVGTDINVPSSPSLAVEGAQKVIEQIPLTEQALKELLARRRVMQMTEDAAMRKIFANSAKAGVPDAIGDNNAIFASNYIRDKIVRAQGNPNDPLSVYDPDMTIQQMLDDPVLGPDMQAYAARRIIAQQAGVEDPIRDRILVDTQYGGMGFNEGQYRAIVQEAQRLNDAGIPFSDAIRQVLDDSTARRNAGEILPEVVRDSGMARINDPRANQRLNMLTDEQVVELVRQLGTVEARKAIGSPDLTLWQDRLNRINSQGTPIPGRSDTAIAAFTEMDDAALLRMLEGRNREKVRKQLGVPTQAFYERVNRLLGEAE